MPIQVRSTIKVYFEIIYDYHRKVMLNESPNNRDFFIERMHSNLEALKGIYDVIAYTRNQSDKNHLSVAEFMCKEVSKL